MTRKRIKKELTHQYVRELFLYNPDTGILTYKKNPPFRLDKIGTEVGRIKDNGNGKLYKSVEIFNKPYYVSRLIYFYMMGEWPKVCIDHINGNSLDNRWDNIREATYAENNRNHVLWKREDGLPVGVTKMKSGRYTSKIVYNRKAIHLGTFDTAEEAHKKYIEARRQYFGAYHGF